MGKSDEIEKVMFKINNLDNNKWKIILDKNIKITNSDKINQII
jgi:hypothetical protein